MWILIIILHGFSSRGYTLETYATSVEFITKEACENAAATVRLEHAYENDENHPSAYCVSKGIR